jgi:putative intracellular protease/amidase
VRFNVILFDGFETLDAFGPIEVMGVLSEHVPDSFEIGLYSEGGGIIASTQNVRVDTLPLAEVVDAGIILIPGGAGIRQAIGDTAFIRTLADLCGRAQHVLTVCTGSAALAKTGLLKEVKATSNKRLFDMVAGMIPDVRWVRRARWVRDGKYYTSSGVSAGIDMTLGFVSD